MGLVAKPVADEAETLTQPQHRFEAGDRSRAVAKLRNPPTFGIICLKRKWSPSITLSQMLGDAVDDIGGEQAFGDAVLDRGGGRHWLRACTIYLTLTWRTKLTQSLGGTRQGGSSAPRRLKLGLGCSIRETTIWN
jgi:hypothetical protein